MTAVFTKKIIIQTLIELLNERPFSKITVKDIVERCGVNRNTFYYHFRDIPDVMEYAVKMEVDQIMKTHVKQETILENLASVVEHLEMNKKALLHIYRSIDRGIFIRDLDKLCSYFIKEYIEPMPYVQSLTQQSREILLHYEKCTMVGVAIDWLESGMSFELSDFIRKLYGAGVDGARMILEIFSGEKED